MAHREFHHGEKPSKNSVNSVSPCFFGVFHVNFCLRTLSALFILYLTITDSKAFF